ncbi:MAG: NAD(+) synthase [Myxococcota bacterium]
MLIRVAAVALNQTPLDWEGNTRRIEEALVRAKAAGATVVCLPELSITGYGCEDAFGAAGVIETAWEMLSGLLPKTRGMIVSFGLPTLFESALYNTACLAVDGQISGLVAKQFLAGDGIHYEPRWFKPWPRSIVRTARVAGAEVPIGDLLFDIGGPSQSLRLGFEICEDAWVADRPGIQLARHGVDLILNPSASHFAFGKLEIRKRFVVEGSRAFSSSYVYSNLLGNESGRIIFDGGALIASGGNLLAVGPRLGFEELTVTLADVDVTKTRMAAARTVSFRPDQSDLGPRAVRAELSLPPVPLGPSIPEPSRGLAWESSAALKHEEFARAVALGLFDYLRKSRSLGFVISLSGGADSAALACLVRLALIFGEKELGPERFRARLGAPADPAAILTTAYQSTRNSSETTRSAAEAVAKKVGSAHLELDVDGLVEGYVERIEAAIGRSLSWERDDLALQNIQARVRAPSVWLLANLRRALLLTTSNRSEAAVGYATMDGDTAGGLAPIAGIDKAYLLSWLHWLETQGPAETGPWPELEAVTRQAPTAELRPQGNLQTDEKDLMPYPVLDAIERRAIRDKEMPTEIWEALRRELPEYEASALAVWVERFFRLFVQNQWKRERYAPSFHLDDENLDPKTWCRFPILSGGYGRELARLRARAQELIA